MSKIQQRYVIVFAAMLLQAIPFGIAQNIPPLFISPLEKTFHFSLSGIGLIFTIGAVASSLTAPFIGRLFRSHKIKYIMLGGLIVSAAGVIANSMATHLWMFLITSAVTQIGTITFSGLGIPYLIGTWFTGPSKAKALGIAFSGGSIGNFFLQPIVEHLLAGNPVGRVYLIMGMVSLVIGVVTAVMFVKPNAHVDATGNHTPKVPLPGIGYKQTLALKSFWLLAGFYALIGLAVAAMSVQYANYFHHLHISPTVIGTVGSVFAVSCLVGNLMGGWLFGKFGVVKSMSVAFIFQTTALLALMVGLGGSKLALVAAFGWAAIYGLNVFSYTSAPALIVQGLFGMKQSSEILGTFSIFFAVGFAAGNVIFGAIVDAAGYGVGWGSVLVYTVIGYIGLIMTAGVLGKKKYSAAPPDPGENGVVPPARVN